MADFHLHITGTLGWLLGVCLAAGVFADFLHLPKVTAYLLVGLLVGPSLLNLVPPEHPELFGPVLKLAMAFVLFNLGCEFTFTKFRRIAKHCLILSAAEIFVTFAMVTLGLLVFGCPANMALLLGCLAVATAPATTILVLKEFRSEGPVTESTGFLVAINNFACIMMFEFGFLAIQYSQGQFDGSLANQIGAVLANIAGSIALGIDFLLHPDEPASRAFELFQAETDDCIPVVTRAEPHELLGVVRRSDVVHALITQRRKSR